MQFAAWFCITLAASLWASNLGVASHHTQKIPLLMGKDRVCIRIKTHEPLVCSGQQWTLWAIKSVFVTYGCAIAIVTEQSRPQLISLLIL